MHHQQKLKIILLLLTTATITSAFKIQVYKLNAKDLFQLKQTDSSDNKLLSNNVSD